MNQPSYQTGFKDSSWMVAYEPVPWVFRVRIVQMVFTMVTLICSAYAASKWMAGVPIAFFAISWSIIYLPAVVWVFPRIQGRYMPNVIALVLESLTWLWWLSSFSIMASWVSGTMSGYGAVSPFYRRDSSSSDYSSSSSTYDDIVDDAMDAYQDAVNSYYGGAWTALKVATAFGAFTWILFTVTLFAISMRFHQQRRGKQQQLNQTYGNPNDIEQNRGAPVESDKTYPQASVNSVHA